MDLVHCVAAVQATRETSASEERRGPRLGTARQEKKSFSEQRSRREGGAEKSVESRSGMSQQSIVVGMLVALLAASSSTYAQEMSGLIQAMKKGPAVDINEVI